MAERSQYYHCSDPYLTFTHTSPKSTIGSSSTPQDWTAHLILRDHQYPVGCLAWSLDDSVLLTSSENSIKMWNVKARNMLLSTRLRTHTESYRLALAFALLTTILRPSRRSRGCRMGRALSPGQWIGGLSFGCVTYHLFDVACGV